MGRFRTETVLKRLALLLAAGAAAFAITYILFLSTTTDEFGAGSWRSTNFGSAVHDPEAFFKVLLDALTFAGLLFIVASGFSLIFGLMRVVNMAHGSFYLLGGYIAYEIQQKMSPEALGYSAQPFQTSTWEWVLPLLVTVGCIALFGLAVQQLLLRWNQGQDLRQALITIAISVVVADQVIAHFPRSVPEGAPKFGGNAVSIAWPGWSDRLVNLELFGIEYSLSRLLMLALGVLVGIVLYLWLYKTKTGMVIRAGVDDRQMTAALGINIQTVFAIAFVVGAGLAGLGAVVGTSQANVAQLQDGQWLLYSLVVVIVGGMGSLFGAVAGSLLYAIVFTFSASYLPTTGNDCCTQYSIVFTFVLLALVLAFRPQGLFGRAG
ncbi:MAG: branched-chain amino acid ABC transporter permease [Gaiellales bacterium]